MKKSFKGFIMGLIMGLVISCVCVGAVNSVVTKELHYNDIKVTLNGQEITPKDANGNVVEPFIIDGTTYLPVRAVASALGLDVNWDGETNTVKLGKDSGNASDSEDIPSGAGSVIYDKDGVKITYQELYDEEFHICYYKFLVENNSDEDKVVGLDNLYINNCRMGGIGTVKLKSGKKDPVSIPVYQSRLKECNISEVETMEFDVKVYPDEILVGGPKIVAETVIFKP